MTPRRRIEQTERLRRVGHALTSPAALGLLLAIVAAAFFIVPAVRPLAGN